LHVYFKEILYYFNVFKTSFSGCIYLIKNTVNIGKKILSVIYYCDGNTVF